MRPLHEAHGIATGTPAVGGVAQVGIGLRQPHYREWAERRVPLGFVEVHSENFFAEGGAALAVLEGVRRTHEVSLHGVGLALGSAVGLDEWHLARLARLVERIEPVRVSDHACFARTRRPPDTARFAPAEMVHAADLLPIAFTPASLDILCANVQQVQERLRRPLLVENLSACLSFADVCQMPEPAFLAELVRRTGCLLLLDVNNLVVNALNAERDGRGAAGPVVVAACAFIDALPVSAVGEIHLAGHRDTGGLVIDDHGSRVPASVWTVYDHALRRFGAVPSLIEWDTDVPALDVLLAEAAAAAQRQQAPGIGKHGGTDPVHEPCQGAARLGEGHRLSDATVSTGREREAARHSAVLATLLDTEAAVMPAPAASLETPESRGGHSMAPGATRPAEPGLTEHSFAGPGFAEHGERLRRGLAAYRGNAAGIAERALAAACPTVAALLGPAECAALARALWRASPPLRGDLAQWGRDLPEFIEAQPGLAAGPCLADCARLDAALLGCEAAADAECEPDTLALLAEAPPASLVLRLLPCVRLLASEWPLASAHAARTRTSRFDRHADDDPGGSTAMQAALAERRAESVVIARDGWRAIALAVDAPTFAWMRALQAGSRLDAARLQAGETFDFNAWLLQALQRQWLWKAEVAPEAAVPPEHRSTRRRSA